MCHNVFNVWPKKTLLPVWPRDAEMLDTPAMPLPLCKFCPFPSCLRIGYTEGKMNTELLDSLRDLLHWVHAIQSGWQIKRVPLKMEHQLTHIGKGPVKQR